MPAMCAALREYASGSGIPVPEIENVSPMMMLNVMLGKWSKLTAPKSLVVLFDETDILEGETLISFLRQLRGGFAARAPGVFPTSIALAVEYHGGWDIIEIKLVRRGRNFETVMEEGIRQTLGYRDRFSGAKAGPGPIRCYLLIFDRRPEKPPWEERLRWIPGEEITVAGC
jgi:hypothetical protein